MTNTVIFCIVIYKLSYLEEPDLIILFEIDKSSKVSFHRIIYKSDLEVSFRIERGKKLLHASKKIIKAKTKTLK